MDITIHDVDLIENAVLGYLRTVPFASFATICLSVKEHRMAELAVALQHLFDTSRVTRSGEWWVAA